MWARVFILGLFFVAAVDAQTFTGEGDRERKVTGTGTNELLLIENPNISDEARAYAIMGEVKYEGVTGTAYLELLSTFPGTEPMFTRTLADMGLLKKLEGDSDWRPFALPFDKRNLKAPEKLVMNLVLPGAGTVYLKRVELMPLEKSLYSLKAEGVWWTVRTGGAMGATGGMVTFFLAAAAGLLASKPRRTRKALKLLRVMTLLGIASLAIGFFALVKHQPHEVFFPLFLLGGLMTVIGNVGAVVLRKRALPRTGTT